LLRNGIELALPYELYNTQMLRAFALRRYARLDCCLDFLVTVNQIERENYHLTRAPVTRMNLRASAFWLQIPVHRGQRSCDCGQFLKIV